MMVGVEEILCELERDEVNEQGLPPGFRFHPTDEELITFYLASKVFNGSFCGVDIAEVDLNRCEPWELPDVAKMGEREWYFLSLRDRKYPTGLRTNRATGAGYWKATGKDREVYSTASSGSLLGMKKTLVFYKGRAPRGEKTKWVMHEYRLDGDFSCRHTAKEEWVICRIFHKIGEKKGPPMLQGQNFLHKPTLPNFVSNSLPPLLESHQDFSPVMHQTLTHNNNQNQNQNLHPIHTQVSPSSSLPDLKSLINPLVSQCDIFFPVNKNLFSHHHQQQQPTTSFTSSCSSSSSMSLLRPNFLSHQELTFKELNNAVSKQCRKEAHSRSHYYQLLERAERVQENTKYQNPFVLYGLTTGDVCEMEIPSATVVDVDDGNNVTTTAMDPAAAAAAIDHVMSTEPAFQWW